MGKAAIMKNKKMEFKLENAKQDFQLFWDLIGAEGNIDAALSEFDIAHNASTSLEGMRKRIRI